ncbi:proline-rich protein HaeIII subfamily 1-like [Dasypus novemcinctus]|uniref:proline-rich protein HaeIII subfamily 1-like n=1 Tax=Dasypus novemcinctus TaxID=9361 RepID=UPI0039C90F4A
MARGPRRPWGQPAGRCVAAGGSERRPRAGAAGVRVAPPSQGSQERAAERRWREEFAAVGGTGPRATAGRLPPPPRAARSRSGTPPVGPAAAARGAARAGVAMETWPGARPLRLAWRRPRAPQYPALSPAPQLGARAPAGPAPRPPAPPPPGPRARCQLSPRHAAANAEGSGAAGGSRQVSGPPPGGRRRRGAPCPRRGLRV